MSAYCLSSKIKRTKMCNYANKSSTTDTCFSTAQTTVFLGYSTIYIARSKGSSSAEGRFCTGCVHGHAVNRVGITVCQCFSTGVLRYLRLPRNLILLPMASKGSCESNRDTGTIRHLRPLDTFSLYGRGSIRTPLGSLQWVGV